MKMVLKVIYWIIALPLAAVIIIFSLNNQAKVVIDLWPFDFIAIPIPIFIIALVCIVLGFLVGSLIVWKPLWISRRKLISETLRADRAEHNLLAKEECLNDLRKASEEPKTSISEHPSNVV
jgi:hypothetical protein